MKTAAQTAAAISSSGGAGRAANLREVASKHQLYDLHRVVSEEELGSKLDIVREAHDGAKSHDPRIMLAQSILLDQLQHMTIANSEDNMTWMIEVNDSLLSASFDFVTVTLPAALSSANIAVLGVATGLKYQQNAPPSILS